MFLFKGQPPPEGGEGEREGEKAEDRKQKENTAYTKKMVLRLAGFMGVGGAVAIVYIFGESSLPPETASTLRQFQPVCFTGGNTVTVSQSACSAAGLYVQIRFSLFL